METCHYIKRKVEKIHESWGFTPDLPSPEKIVKCQKHHTPIQKVCKACFLWSVRHEIQAAYDSDWRHVWAQWVDDANDANDHHFKLEGISPQLKVEDLPESFFFNDFEKSFPYATTLINFENALIDYSICRLPKKNTEENKKAELSAHAKVLKMYNHLLTLLQENNISPNDYYG